MRKSTPVSRYCCHEEWWARAIRFGLAADWLNLWRDEAAHAPEVSARLARMYPALPGWVELRAPHLVPAREAAGAELGKYSRRTEGRARPGHGQSSAGRRGGALLPPPGGLHFDFQVAVLRALWQAGSRDR